VGESFAEQLRRHRLLRRLSQEELAERADLSVRSVGELERGRSPRPGTISRLVAALRLEDADRQAFVDAGRGEFRSGHATRAGRLVDAVRASTEPRQLPPDLPDFVGRDSELASLSAGFDRTTEPLVVALSGPPGVGKTALAVHLAHMVAARFADGQIYLGLQPSVDERADPGSHLDAVLRALGIDGSVIPAELQEKAAIFRSRVAGRHLLVVLDNAARHRQVEPLLPPAGSALVVTSRLPLTGLPGVTSLDLSPLPIAAAVDLLGNVAGRDRVNAEPDAAEAVVTACGGLPLAVRLAGARLAARPGWNVLALAERLSDESRRLDELRHGDLAVRSVLELAHGALSPASARAFALLGVLPGPAFPDWALPPLLGGSPELADAAVESLLDSRLVSHWGPDAAGQQRLGLHDLTRVFAVAKARTELREPAMTQALARATEAWLQRAAAARRDLVGHRLLLDDGKAPTAAPVENPATKRRSRKTAGAWFEAEREALVALVQSCARAGLHSHAWRLAACSADFFDLRGYTAEWSLTCEAGLQAARQAGDENGIVAMLRGVGGCKTELGDWKGALDALGEARERARRGGMAGHAAIAQRDMGLVYSLTHGLDRAVPTLRDAEAELGRAGLHSHRAVALANLGFALREQGQLAQAVQTLQAAVSVAHERGDTYSQAYTDRALGAALVAAGDVSQAYRHAQRAAAAFTDLDDYIGVAQSLRVWGEALGRDPYRLREAVHVLGQALELFREHAYSWGIALTELSLGETLARHRDPRSAELLRRSLTYWTEQQVPTLQDRALQALRSTIDAAPDPSRGGVT
jgi:tetratricopeptide (TPR) repeat protein/transcriptional regulator with XRE-family HTH domain